MIDQAALGSWIQPQHLEEQVLTGYRQSLESHPARLVVLEDFLVDGMAQKLTRFLTSEAQFQKEYGLNSAEGAVSEEQWGEAPQEDRFFRLGRLAGIPPQYQLS